MTGEHWVDGREWLRSSTPAERPVRPHASAPGHCCQAIDRTDARSQGSPRRNLRSLHRLDAPEDQSIFPSLYTNARDGVGPTQKSATIPKDLLPLFETIVKSIPRLPKSPKASCKSSNESRLQRFSRPHRHRPRIQRHHQARHGVASASSMASSKPRASPSSTRFAVSSAMKLKAFFAGDLVAIAGVEGIQIGESIIDPGTRSLWSLC